MSGSATPSTILSGSLIYLADVCRVTFRLVQWTQFLFIVAVAPVLPPGSFSMLWASLGTSVIRPDSFGAPTSPPDPIVALVRPLDALNTLAPLGSSVPRDS